MQVTTEQLVEDLYEITRRLKRRWNRDDNRQRAEILVRLEDARGWKGRTNRYLRVPSQPHLLLHLERTTLYGLIASFEDLENALGLGSHEEWRGECEDCGAVLPSVDEATCDDCTNEASNWARHATVVS